ncbi:MAG: NADH-quinone oxidoreductase subunit NuoB [Bdellovibrionota bacterium]
MLGEIKARINQGYRTIKFPDVEPDLPERFRGMPKMNCKNFDCKKCKEACPTGAISIAGAARDTGATQGAGTIRQLKLDMGRCIFCTDCVLACPEKAISFTRDYGLSANDRDDLILKNGQVFEPANALKKETLRIFGRSLKLRQVSAGGCNACEMDTQVLSTVVFDLERFGIQFVASPRHADGLLITGPVTESMRLALEKTYEAVPNPKIVIAVGACAISGGLYAGHDEVAKSGATEIFPVDLYIPGCPPHPITILDGLLRLIGKRWSHA